MTLGLPSKGLGIMAQEEEQVELIVRGKMDGLCGQLVYAIGVSEGRANPLVGSDFMFR
jgi:hypothetical protein